MKKVVIFLSLAIFSYADVASIEYMIQAMVITTHVKQVLAKCVMVVNL